MHSHNSLNYRTKCTSWGKPRNPSTWQTSENVVFKVTARGYTLHEHIALFDIINMNGRLYDAKLGRMLSPDNYIQAPTSTQSYNRYSYAFNNPLKYVDPDGNWAISGQNATHNRSRMGTAGWNMVWRDFTGGGDPAMAEITRQNMYQGAYIGKDYDNMDDMVKDAWDATPAGTDLGYTYSYGSLTGTYIPDASRRTLPTNWAEYNDNYYAKPNQQKSYKKQRSNILNVISSLFRHRKYNMKFANDFLEESANKGGGDYLRYEANFVNTYRTQGNLIWYNSSGEVVATYPAVSGASNIESYTITEGIWNTSYLNSTPHEKYSRNGVSFRVTLGPDRYDPLRGRETGLIRIHPARSMGTEGCIGLIGDRTNLLDFYNRYSNYYNTYGTMPVYVIYPKP